MIVKDMSWSDEQRDCGIQYNYSYRIVFTPNLLKVKVLKRFSLSNSHHIMTYMNSSYDCKQI